MPKFFRFPWASTGDKTTIPDETDVAGFVSYQQGYGNDYARDPASDPLAKLIERDKMNQLYSDLTENLQYWQTHTFPEYITAEQNGGVAYAYDVDAIVRYDGGTGYKNYLNTVAGNTNLPTGTGWVEYKIEAIINAATAEATPADGDIFAILDSAASFALKKITWSDVKTALSSFFVPTADPTFTGTVSVDSSIVFEGSTADAFETTLTVVDPTADRTLFLPNESGTIATQAYVDGKMVLATSVTASGTAVDFTGIPSWAKRITVMFDGVSTNGTSNVQIQIGTSSGIETSGYKSMATYIVTSGTTTAEITSGMVISTSAATDSKTGTMKLCLIGSNLWVSDHTMRISTATGFGGGNKTLAGALDRLRITTVNGTDRFDAGTINIMYEG